MKLSVIASFLAILIAIPGDRAFAPFYLPSLRPQTSTRRASSPSAKEAGPEDVTEESIRSLFYLWNNALATGESRLVAKRYAKDAVLLPAVSDRPRMDYDSIKQYYDEFLKKQPQKEIIEGRVKIGNGWAEDSGICEIVLRAEGNARIRARYSFLYVWEDHRWKILHHHSSVMPEHQQPAQLKDGAPPAHTPSMTVERVQNFFQLYNDALETKDVKAVSQLFSKTAVMFPMESEKPLKSPVEIKKYFKDFLERNPKIRILDSHITIGPDQTWAKDMGTFELKQRADQSKVKCRYAFDYGLESDGHWKITHYQATPLSNSFVSDTLDTASLNRALAQRMYAVSNTMSDDDVRGLFQKWNDALQTKNPSKVAERYARKAVLAPTICETPHSTPKAIQEFYESFLLSQPRAKPIQSFVSVHNHWCKDVGILEYTFDKALPGQEQRKVKERYSFLYVWEDDEWKIAHHHSTFLPEGFQPNADRVAGIEPDDQNPKTDRAAWL